MNRILTGIGLAGLVLAALPPTVVAADNPALEDVRDKVTEMFDAIDREDVNPAPIDGWFTIHKGSIVAYISEDGRYLLQGELIDLETQVNLTEAARSESREQLMSAVPDDRTIVFAPEDPEFSVTVFTDVDCVYCRRLHAQIDEYLAKGIEVRYLLYPRNGPASPSWNTAERVWCAPNRQKALTLAKLDRAFESGQCNASAVEDHYSLGQRVGLSGTPAIVLEDGELIGGYLPPDALRARLEQKSGMLAETAAADPQQ